LQQHRIAVAPPFGAARRHCIWYRSASTGDQNISEPYSVGFHSGSGAELQIHWQAGRRAGIYIYEKSYH
jgi:hypothetical protein